MEYNQDFKFYITTKLSNPHYTPEIATKTTIVNFAVKEQGLQAQLLGIVVRKERPELEEQKDKLVLSIASSKKNLADLEDKILHLLSTSQGSILDDEALVTALQSSKRTAEEVTEQLEVAEQTEVKIDGAREVNMIKCLHRVYHVIIYDVFESVRYYGLVTSLPTNSKLNLSSENYIRVIYCSLEVLPQSKHSFIDHSVPPVGLQTVCSESLYPLLCDERHGSY